MGSSLSISCKTTRGPGETRALLTDCDLWSVRILVLILDLGRKSLRGGSQPTLVR